MTLYPEKTQYDLLMLDNILQYAPDWIYWKDVNSIHLGCSEQFAIAAGFKNRLEMIGKSDYECAWGNRAEKYNFDDREIIQSGKPKLNIEDIVLLNSGKEVTVISNKVPLRNSKGKIIGILGIATDITQRKNMEEELKQAKEVAEIANEAKSEFIANMSHDIRTPLTGIVGMAQDLFNVADTMRSVLQGSSSGIEAPTREKLLFLLKQIVETVLEDSQLLMESTDVLLALCNEILETMRLESGQASQEPESFNLQEMIRHNINLFIPVARHKEIALTYEMGRTVPVYSKGLINYLDRTLLNLLSNALKFTSEGFVQVKVFCINETETSRKLNDTVTLQIVVEDSGIGIPEDKFETIFEHFSRLTPSWQGLYKGAGLGLYTVKRYIEAMNATIDVESTLGKGSRFIITLPLVVSDHSDRERSIVIEPKTNKTETVKISRIKGITDANAAARILIVEDNLIAAITLQNNLKHLDCASDHAKNGQQAIKMAQDNDYDLILMDIGLGDGIDGIETTRRIRALNFSRTREVPIIAVTGHAGDPKSRQQALDAGMQEVCSKPLPQSQLEFFLQEFVFKKRQKGFSPHDDIKSSGKQDSEEVIDWNACLEKVNNNESFLRDLLSMMDVDLKLCRDTLAVAYDAHDTEALRAELHRVRGGVAYLALPQLENILASFHAAVKEIPPNPEQIECKYQALQQAMDAFWQRPEKYH